MSDIITKGDPRMPKIVNVVDPRMVDEPVHDKSVFGAKLVAAVAKDLATPDASLQRLAELLVELKVRPYRDMCANLKEHMPEKVETPEAIMLWLHDWAERQLKA